MSDAGDETSDTGDEASDARDETLAARAEFLAGERTDDVVLFFSASVVEDDRLERFGTSVDGGVLIVIDGERGRSAFEAATGLATMEFAGAAMDHEGIVDESLADGTCPEESAGGEHALRYMLAFSEAQNEDVGGIYADGPVVHAYAACSCGTAYSDRWTIQE